MKPPTLSESGERSIELLRQTVAQYRKISGALNRGRRDSRLTSPHDIDEGDIQRQTTLVRLLSITESYCAARLTNYVEQKLDVASSKIHAAIWEKTAIDVTSNWANQKDAYKKWLEVDPEWRWLEGLAEARNSVSHGLGHLTRRQLRSRASTSSKISAAGLSLSGNALIITDDSLIRAMDICCNLIIDIEGQMPR